MDKEAKVYFVSFRNA